MIDGDNVSLHLLPNKSQTFTNVLELGSGSKALATDQVVLKMNMQTWNNRPSSFVQSISHAMAG